MADQVMEDVIIEPVEPVAEHEEHQWVVDDRPAVEVVVGQGGEEFLEVDEIDHEQIIEMHHDDVANLTMADFDDGYPSLLPVRDGAPLLTLNLPDLLSRPITFTNEDRMILCFNKKCVRQIAFGGYLYTVQDYVRENAWNVWKCVNIGCEGSVRTSPNYQEMRVRTDHAENCIPDDCQIRLRVAIFDLRLMAEFTDLSLGLLHAGCDSRMKAENEDIAHLFPSYDMMRPTLEDHRINKIYRKRFEMQALKDKQRRYQMTPDEVVFAESTAGAIRFKRTKPFPPALCMECGDEMTSSVIPSQDQLISHITYSHRKPLVVERYTFKEPNVFDQWIRDLNVYSRYKMKKMGLADEHMYFLCTCDDRLSRAGAGRATRTQQQNIHCTAFIRVFDWRLVMRREINYVVVDYCLEHCYHKDMLREGETNTGPTVYDYFSPEVFLREMEERRARTQKLISEHHTLQRVRRTDIANCRQNIRSSRPSFGSRGLAPPIAAQIAGGTSNPVVDSFYNDHHEYDNEGSEAQAGSSKQRRSTFITKKQDTVRPRITDRATFKDPSTFSAVAKAEQTCDALVARLQACKTPKVAAFYKQRLEEILGEAEHDAEMAEAVAEGSDATNYRKEHSIGAASSSGSVFDTSGDVIRRPYKRVPRIVIEKKGLGAELRVKKEMTEDSDEPPLLEEMDSNGDEQRQERNAQRGRGRPRKSVDVVEIPPKRPRAETPTTPSSPAVIEPSRSGRQRKIPARLVE